MKKEAEQRSVEELLKTEKPEKIEYFMVQLSAHKGIPMKSDAVLVLH